MTFHAKLDRDYDQRKRDLEEALARLESERRQAHDWIDSAPDSVLQALGSEPPPETLFVAGDRQQARYHAPLYEPVKSIVESIDSDYEITSPLIYDALLQAIPDFEEEDEWKLKARIAIANTLSRLVDDGVLKLARQGRGSNPNIYKVKPDYKLISEVVSEGERKTKK
jgi:hypothetical protein